MIRTVSDIFQVFDLHLLSYLTWTKSPHRPSIRCSMVSLGVDQSQGGWAWVFQTVWHRGTCHWILASTASAPSSGRLSMKSSKSSSLRPGWICRRWDGSCASRGDWHILGLLRQRSPLRQTSCGSRRSLLWFHAQHLAWAAFPCSRVLSPDLWSTWADSFSTQRRSPPYTSWLACPPLPWPLPTSSKPYCPTCLCCPRLVASARAYCNWTLLWCDSVGYEGVSTWCSLPLPPWACFD